MKKLYLLTLLSILPMIAFGQKDDTTAKKNLFAIDAQIRARGEYRSAPLATTSDLYDAFVNDRVRLGLEYDNDWMTMKISGQHTGVWGQSPATGINTGDFSLKDAWVNFDLNKSKSLYIKLGRQELAYDDERIFGAGDWSVSGRSHDALKFGFKSNNKKHSFDVIGAFNQDSQKGGTYFSANGQPYKHMETGWYHFSTGKNVPFGISLLVSNVGYENGEEDHPSSRNMQTFGTYMTLKPGKFVLDGSFYYQTGKTAADKNINAWMFSFKGTWNVSQVYGMSLGVDWLSGQDNSDKYTVFNPVFGSNHKFYGLIDYWYVNAKSNATGLIDPFITFSVKPAKKLNIALTYHAFFNANNAGSEEIKKNEYRASEVDLQVTWKIKDFLTLMGGYSGFLGGNNFCASEANNTQNWAWIQMNVNPRIFTHKW